MASMDEVLVRAVAGTRRTAHQPPLSSKRARNFWRASCRQLLIPFGCAIPLIAPCQSRPTSASRANPVAKPSQVVSGSLRGTKNTKVGPACGLLPPPPVSASRGHSKLSVRKPPQPRPRNAIPTYKNSPPTFLATSTALLSAPIRSPAFADVYRFSILLITAYLLMRVTIPLFLHR